MGWWLGGGFGSVHVVLPVWGLGAENGSGIRGWMGWDGAWLFALFASSWQAGRFDVIRCRNRMENGWVVHVRGWGGVLAYFGLRVGCFGRIFWGVDFGFFCLPFALVLGAGPVEGRLGPDWPFWPCLGTPFWPGVGGRSPSSSCIFCGLVSACWYVPRPSTSAHVSGSCLRGLDPP